MNSICQRTYSRAVLSVIGALLFAASCTTTTTQSFKVGKSTEVEASYIAVDADFSRYDRILDFRNATGADVPKVRRELADIARPGALLFLMELKDPTTGKILARAADSASAPAFSTSPATATDWDSVDAAAARWAGLFRSFLDQNLKQ